jgi:hypothetical protein
MRTAMATRLTAFLLGVLSVVPAAFGNGGPFVVKYPSGDPAAKGVLARLDPTLKPAQETRLRVVKEDLTIRFVPEQVWEGDKRKLPPLTSVTAAYTIENPTDEEVTVDFGFPILRGIYLRWGMVPYPDVTVQVDKQRVYPTIISNSSIYGIIRRNAAEVIERGVAADADLARLVADVRGAWIVKKSPAKQASASLMPANNANRAAPAPPPFPPGTRVVAREKKLRYPARNYAAARDNLRNYLTDTLKWNGRDAALLVEYASLDFGYDPLEHPRDLWDAKWWAAPSDLEKLKKTHLGPLTAIGEQKATQFFAQLASRFDKTAGSNYEAIFAAWGGDVRERSLDLTTGQLRPREITLPETTDRAPKPSARLPQPPGSIVATGNLTSPAPDMRLTADPTVYARVDYLDPNAKLTKEEKASCQAILQDLPVVFTFAPMNLLYYQAKFPAKSTRMVRVSYRQYAFADTRGSGSYQLAYVLHPATLWQDFGPIHLTLNVPEGVACRASAAVERDEHGPISVGDAIRSDSEAAVPHLQTMAMKCRVNTYHATLDKPEQKQGELFVAVDKTAWDKAFSPAKPKPAAQQRQPTQTSQR